MSSYGNSLDTLPLVQKVEINGKEYNALNLEASTNIIYRLERGEIMEEVVMKQNDLIAEQRMTLDVCSNENIKVYQIIDKQDQKIKQLENSQDEQLKIIATQQRQLNEFSGQITGLHESRKKDKWSKIKSGALNVILGGAAVYFGGKHIGVF